VDLSIRTETFGQDDQSWIIQCDPSTNKGITLDYSAFTEATHYPDGYFKSGIALGKITATGLYAPYVTAAVDGTGVLAGFLYAAVPARTTTDPGGALMRVGVVREAKLLAIVADAATGGGFIDTTGKADVVAHIFFD
jgi:hypothetical protein